MNICHLIDHMGLGGAQSMVVDLVELHDPANSPTVMTLRDSMLPCFRDRLRSARVPHRSLALTRTSVTGPWRLRRALDDGQFDLLHAHLDYSNSAGILTALSLLRSRPVIVSQIHLDPALQNSALFRITARYVAPYIDTHLVATRSLGKMTSAALRHRARRIETIELGIDIERFTKSRARSASSDALRRGAKRTISYVGRLAPQKNIDTLLHAMPELLRLEPSTRLLIVGDGPDKSSLQSVCQQIGITSSVTFTGYMDDVTTAYDASDVFVLPSWHEGFGIVLVEAMAMGVPVVATPSTGIVDVVEDEKSALLVPPGDPAGFSKAIQRLFEDESLNRRLVETGRQTAESKFSRARMARRMEALYDDVLSNRSKRSA